jgi:hypothetical protein
VKRKVAKCTSVFFGVLLDPFFKNFRFFRVTLPHNMLVDDISFELTQLFIGEMLQQKRLENLKKHS